MNIDDRDDAWEVVVFADKHSDRELLQVLQRGLSRYETEGGEESYLSDIDLAAKWMFDENKYMSPFEKEHLDSASGVALLCAMAACGIRKHDYFADAPFDKIQLVTKNATYLYTALLNPLFGNASAEFQWRMFSRVYHKEIDKKHPRPSRVATAIVRHEDSHPKFNWFIEIPVACASEICLARFNEGKWQSTYERESNGAAGSTNYHMRDNFIYVPCEHGKKLLSEQAHEAFLTIVEYLWERTEESELNMIFNECEHIKAGVDDILDHGEEERLWTDFDPQDNLVELVRNAVKEQPDLDANEWTEAADYYDAITVYEPDGFGESRAKEKLKSARALSVKLRNIAEADDYSMVKMKEFDSRQHNVYTIGSQSGNAEEISVGSLDDIFQLPCFQNMEETLKLENSGPVRKDLYNFVRMVYWLKGYHEMPEGQREDAVVEDMHDLFEKKWDWYNPAKTEYQSRYELREGEINGNTPLPMHCDNDDMQRHCIGKNLCPYSIYGSLPFPQEMYDMLDDDRA